LPRHGHRITIADMTDSDIRRVDAPALKAQLHDGGEIAVLDAREEGVFAARHLFMAACVPLGRLEERIDDMVPRRAARVVWCDDGDGLAARAAARMAALGYDNVAVLDGGIAAWEDAGYRLYSGVHVPSKAFAEVVEHEAATPWISAEDLSALIESGADITIYDSRSYGEYHNNSIPTAISVPGAELVYRFADLTPSPDTMVIVNCGGRTRSIIGAQSLIDAGFPNKIVSLKDGTMAWHLAGLDVVQGAARQPPDLSDAGGKVALNAAARVAARNDIARIDLAALELWRGEAAVRSLYLIDVRTLAEYQVGHLPGSRSFPGGQLVQETDSHAATWGARIVLIDDNGVRATMTASWLKQMGWRDIAVLALDRVAVGALDKGPYIARVLGLEDNAARLVAVADLRAGLDDGSVQLVDLNYSRNYAQNHIPGAWFATRGRLADALTRLPDAKTIVLTSPDGVLARLAAAELDRPVLALDGGTQAWAEAGLPLEAGTARLADTADDVQLSARERGENREDAMRAYLAWEIELVNQMASDDDQRFAVMTG
jgi:rhodanese-related sulfurtransferase